MLTPQDIELLKEPQIAIVATNSVGKAPQQTPVWVDTDGEYVIFNTSRGRIKHRNLTGDPLVSVCVVDSKNPYRWVSVRGRAELVEEGADQHIDFLAKKYLDKETYPMRQPGEVRVIVKVKPTNRIGS